MTCTLQKAARSCSRPKVRRWKIRSGPCEVVVLDPGPRRDVILSGVEGPLCAELHSLAEDSCWERTSNPRRLTVDLVIGSFDFATASLRKAITPLRMTNQN